MLSEIVLLRRPDGSILRPKALDDGSLELSSAGRGFGDAGFYRIQRSFLGGVRVWRVRSLDEYFRVYVDEHGTLRSTTTSPSWGCGCYGCTIVCSVSSLSA